MTTENLQKLLEALDNMQYSIEKLIEIISNK